MNNDEFRVIRVIVKEKSYAALMGGAIIIVALVD
ncbi:hypothetical protein Asulf_02052 [Archaeoglobus sulfaticallidus PM70-1]|uniref:Uncharacterized protein n=1 Tax=Archaeoglobus sulfaticallidus PM70-1 TaxID=387631 RepID=N0BEH8_9EURY|nr:hypothetical protein Asulf_02052 [Archaeoglobus sulfaticallidus PM70-1]